MNKTKISFLDYTWNPLAMRCAPVSPGCANCWHLKVCDRHTKNPKLPEAVRKAKAGGPPVLIEKELDVPIRLKEPSRIGVQFMGDLFHKDVPWFWINNVWKRMWIYTEHDFLVLTKRPYRMGEFLHDHAEYGQFAPDNIWLGTSCENQKWADVRIPLLLQIPAAVRFVSLEPLLGPIDLFGDYADGETPGPALTTTGGQVKPSDVHGPAEYDTWITDMIDWVIVGCESGPGRRPCKLEWVHDIVEQCKAAGVPVFVKQLSINGKVSHNMDEWPEELRIREYPHGEGSQS